MQINIKAHGTQLTDSLREYANKKLNKLEEYYKNIIKTDVVLDVRSIDDIKKSHVVEVSIWVPGKKVLHASDAAENMYAAIDLVFEELKRQIIRHKEKHIDEKRREAEKAKEIQRKNVSL